MSVVEFYMYLRSTALYFRSTAFEQTKIVRSKAIGVKYMYHTGKCIRRFGGIYAYWRYFIDRKW